MKKVIIIICIVILVAISSYSIHSKYREKNTPSSNSNNNSNSIKTGNKPYYSKAGKIDKDESIDNKVVTTYEEYKQILDKYGIDYSLKEEEFNEYDYLAIIIENDYCGGYIDSIEDATINDNNIDILVNCYGSCGVCASTYELYFVRFDKNVINSEYNVKMDYQVINKYKCDSDVVYKPVIYLYPTKDMNVIIKLGKEENLTVTYPKYNNGWNVYAKVDGNLTDENGRNYYALYWEGLSYDIDGMTDEGFVVKGEDTIEFLEEKLSLLGLNERESNEFIMYWLPKLQNNKYNYIRFATSEEIDNSMPLYITPSADTIIRVLMLYKPLDEMIDIKEQKLITPKRNGFTVVEWGGSDI